MGNAKVQLAWRIICLRKRMFQLAENSKDFIVGWCKRRAVERNYTQFVSVPRGCGCVELCKCCKEALCEYKPVHNTTQHNTTQHTSYTSRVSLKLKTNNKLHAAQCCWRSRQLHRQSVKTLHFMKHES